MKSTKYIGEHGIVTPAEHHKAMTKDYKRGFIISTILTIPVLIISPEVQGALGFTIDFPGRIIVLWILSSIIYFYGRKPFLVGLIDELRKRLPGMTTLIGIAISIAYFYSIAVVFFIPGKTFFWELATLIDIMLLGH